MKTLLYAAFGLALIAALVYFLTGLYILQPGPLLHENAPPGFYFIAGAGYIIGAFLILLRKSWLWIIGAIINALVIVIHFAIHFANPAILLSIPGLATKAAQILLEIGLIYLIVIYKQKNRTNQ